MAVRMNEEEIRKDERNKIIEELVGMKNTILIEAFDVNEKYTHGWQNCVDQAISKIKEMCDHDDPPPYPNWVWSCSKCGKEFTNRLNVDK